MNFISPVDARQRTIYEYHRVQIDTAKITNNCAFEFTALPSKRNHTSFHANKKWWNQCEGLLPCLDCLSSLSLPLSPPLSLCLSLTLSPGCLQHNSCVLCLSANQTLGCKWCHVLQRLLGQPCTQTLKHFNTHKYVDTNTATRTLYMQTADRWLHAHLS